MTKLETREATRAIQYSATLGIDYLARALSALHRAARTQKSKDEILALGVAYRAVSSAEWIV